ncbi:MAG: hypothetical protein JXB15_04405 [Anaerolineales bacterium]|nr:hypothetical protein [Anaerolineales bacterium]
MGKNRRSDVDTVLIEATRQHTMIRQGYERALQDKSLDLRVPVKNLMENLRSALDYMAHDVYIACCQAVRRANGKPDPRKIYFPYGRTEEDFIKRVGDWLPNLGTNSPEVYRILLSIQPFSCGDSWLYDLCTILNTNKHDHLTAQTRMESETYSVESRHGSVTIPVNNPSRRVISSPGAVKIFGVPAEFREDGIYTAPSDELKHKHIKWVSFIFADTNMNVINMLDKAVVNIKQLAETLYQMI